MQFTSFAFAIFFPIIFFLYWGVKHKYRMPFLLVVSLLFYMTFSPGYVVLLLLVSMMTYIGAKHVQKSKITFVTLIILEVGTVLFFKYAGFLPQLFHNLIIPVGISFYMFKAISYLADIRIRKYEPEQNAMTVLTYLTFFPDIVSGPINRADLWIPQLKIEKKFQYETAVYGMRQILLGLFKKMLIADTLAIYVNLVFETPGSYMGITYLITSIFYTVQIYCDFSGYSDIAIGLARLLGFQSMENFKSPYFASNIKEFWGRWHISLSSWLKDYIYIPLGGNRKGNMKSYINLGFTFLISGIWHGGNITFLVWGFLHGSYQILYRIYNKHCKWKMPNFLGILVTLSSVSIAWIFFRANTIRDAYYMFRYMFYNLSPKLAYLKLGLNKTTIVMILISVAGLGIFDYFSQKKDLLKEFDRVPVVIRYMIYLVLTSVIMAFHIHGGATQQFIYFQF